MRTDNNQAILLIKKKKQSSHKIQTLIAWKEVGEREVIEECKVGSVYESVYVSSCIHVKIIQ